MSATNDHFNKAAAGWDVRPELLRRSEAVAEYIRDKIRLDRDTTSVLDFGCGTGQVSMLLRRYVRSICAVDSAGGMLEQLENKIVEGGVRNIEVRNMNILREAHMLKSGSFDLVMSQMVMHHIEDVAKIIRELKRLLSVRGQLCLVDLDKEDGTFHAKDMFIPHFGFERSEFGRMLEEAGLFNIRFYTPFTIRKKNYAGVMGEFPLFMVIADNFAPVIGGDS